MYHGTDADCVSSILEQGFKPSDGPNQMLGNGVYVSKTIDKAANYGEVVFRLLVYPGHVIRIDRQDHPKQKTWQENYGSAWVPANCGMVPSGLEVRSQAT